MEEFGSIDIIYPVISNYIIKQLASICMFHNEVEFTFSFNNLIQLNNSGMSNFLQYFDLSSNSINIGLILDFIFLQYFYCYFFLGNCVNTQLHFSEGAFSESLINKEIRYLPQFLLVFLLIFGFLFIRFDSKNELLKSLFLFLEISQLTRCGS